LIQLLALSYRELRLLAALVFAVLMPMGLEDHIECRELLPA
jgi:hypothetical protein